MYKRAEDAVDREELETARAIVEHVLKQYPKSIRANRLLGKILERQGLEDAAFRQYVVVASTDPLDGDIYATMASLSERNGKAQQAQFYGTLADDHHSGRSGRILPIQSVISPTRLAILNERSGLLAQAAQQISNILSQHPARLDLYLLLARSLVALRLWDLASPAVSAVLESSADCLEANVMQAVLDLRKGDQAMAMEHVERALACDPQADRIEHFRAAAELTPEVLKKARVQISDFEDARLVDQLEHVSPGDLKPLEDRAAVAAFTRTVPPDAIDERNIPLAAYAQTSGVLPSSSNGGHQQPPDAEVLREHSDERVWMQKQGKDDPAPEGYAGERTPNQSDEWPRGLPDETDEEEEGRVAGSNSETEMTSDQPESDLPADTASEPQPDESETVSPESVRETEPESTHQVTQTEVAPLDQESADFEAWFQEHVLKPVEMESMGEHQAPEPSVLASAHPDVDTVSEPEVVSTADLRVWDSTPVENIHKGEVDVADEGEISSATWESVEAVETMDHDTVNESGESASTIEEPERARRRWRLPGREWAKTTEPVRSRLADLAEIVEREPLNNGARFALARALEDADPNQAIGQYSLIVSSRDPRLIEDIRLRLEELLATGVRAHGLQRLLGDAYMQQGSFERAIESYSLAFDELRSRQITDRGVSA